MKFNINNKVVIYPNQRGWDKIFELTKEYYRLDRIQIVRWLDNRKTEDGGFEEQLWCLIDIYHSMFFHGQNYFTTAYIKLDEDQT
ncbi:MAG TPA: hypothetical protein VMV77_04370 [Bacteroidales bacterium]|nr:hypothetical protein [Bacteroidales bacterium]